MNSLVTKFKGNPTWFYALSICATWAGAGSLIVGADTVQQMGVVPFLLWGAGNALSCVFFGICVTRFKWLENIFTSEIYKVILMAMSVFQIWVNMSAINQSLSPISVNFAIIATYVVCIAFLIYYMTGGMIRNVLTDGGGWLIVYALIFTIAIVSVFTNGIQAPAAGLTAEGIEYGARRFFTLLIGPFFYPYFWAMLKYNDGNSDNTSQTSMRTSFALGGMLFGIYLCFVFIVALTTLSPAMEIVKGILLALIAISTLTSFIFSILIMYNKKIGCAVNLLTFIGWKFLIPLGVMGIWNIMQDVRFTVLVASIIIYLIWRKFYAKEEKAEHSDGVDERI